MLKITKLLATITMLLVANSVCAANTVKIETPLYISNIDINTGQIIDVSLKRYTDDVTPGKHYSIVSQNGLQLNGKYFTSTDNFFQAYTHYEKHVEGSNTYLLFANSPYTPSLKRKIVFDDKNYRITVSDTLVNTTTKPIDVAYHVALSTTSEPSPSPLISSYKGFMFVDQDNKVHKHREKSVIKSPLFGIENPQMVAYSDRFFSTVVSSTSKTRKLQSIERDGRIEMVLATDLQSIPRTKSFSTTTTIYAGPVSPTYINKVTDIPRIDAVLDYGFLTTISNMAFNVLSWINQFIPNYGFAIIAMTLLIRFAIYPLNIKVEHSNRKIKSLQPEIDEITANYTPEQARLLIKDLLKENKVNPLLNMFMGIIQIPIFLSVLWMLVSNSELRDSPWVLWITDLSSKDPYMILPFVFALLVYIQNRINSRKPAADYLQWALNIMPFSLFLIFTMLPAGIILYAITNTVVTMTTRSLAQNKLSFNLRSQAKSTA